MDRPQRDTLSLTLRHAQRTEALVLWGRPRLAQACLLDERPRGAAADGFTQKLRRILENGRIKAISRDTEGRLSIAVERGTHAASLVVLPQSNRPAFVLCTASREVIASTGLSPAPREGSFWDVELTELSVIGAMELREAGPDYLGSQQSALGDFRRDLLKRVRSTQKRARRKIRAIEGDIARLDRVDILRAEGQIILSSLHEISPGQTEFEAMDWHQSPPAPRKLALRADVSAKAQAEDRFHQARRLERGAKVSHQRLELAHQALARLETLRLAIESATDGEELQALQAEGHRLGVSQGQTVPSGNARRKGPTRSPFRRYRSIDGLLILVGRGGADNDRLTLDHTRPHDRWLHARGCPGAHVVIALDKRQACPAETLLDAATLAAHFSKFRGDGVIDVQHTERRHVRKPKGSPPGSVLIDREKVIPLRIEASRLTRLLNTEEKA